MAPRVDIRRRRLVCQVGELILRRIEAALHARRFVAELAAKFARAATELPIVGHQRRTAVDELQRDIIIESDASFAQLFIGVFYLDATLLGAWSALYYAINFFLQVEEQNDQLIRLENQATSAQLAMLRYQLNPHFLFNTLNSISTLVLLKQTEPANAMLSRLTSFLRYTLINEPGSRVTVAQEVDTLKLYLDIERMRFEERLRTTFNIDPATATALLPSLLLQPLVENAIKYAVGPQESGAHRVLVQQQDDRIDRGGPLERWPTREQLVEDRA